NNDQLRSVGPSGTIAGLITRIDRSYGVWKASAGIQATLNNVSSLEYFPTDQENAALNQLGINCLRSFPPSSFVCWGARTLIGDEPLTSEWKYIPVRRLALFIEETVYRGTKWAVLEPNDESLWSEIRLDVGAFLHDLFQRGAFQGTTPEEAYFVKCDGGTTTEDDIDRGFVNIVVGFAGLRPAEFLILRIEQRTGENG
ncbi:MAG: phage tail sheath C-terminal domain-containing protein, partial [Bacteroidota bacterium]